MAIGRTILIFVYLAQQAANTCIVLSEEPVFKRKDSRQEAKILSALGAVVDEV
jgi:hypothetical protein